ncbi:MAG: 3-isopropylmalate dehydratase, partial [Burkholderiales bacterium]
LQDGATVQFDLERATVRDAEGNTLAQCEALPDFLLEIVRDGGLIPNLKKRLATQHRASGN